MGIDFDESGRNDEYGAEVGESTGEPGDTGRRSPAAPIVVQPTPQMHGSANDLIRSIMGTTSPVTAPQTAAEALEVSQDSYMEEVEKRLEIAAYYRAALANPMFDNDTEAARTVQHEFSGFIRERLGVLLSIGEPKPKETTFTEAQVEILRLLGDLTPGHVTALRMIASKVSGEAPPPREPPVIRQAQAPAGPKPRPAPVAAARRVPAPPAAAPVSTQPQAQPTTTPERRGPGRPLGSKNKPKEDVEFVQAVRRHPDGTEEPLYNKDGSPRMVKVAPKRVQRPAGALPFPNDTQISQVSSIQAQEHAAKLEMNPQVQKALQGLQNPV